MKEDFVTYELAIKLKDKGYPQNGFHYYNENGRIDVPAYNLSDEDMSDTVAPQIHEVLKWLREEKNIYINISYSRMDKWFYKIYNLKNTGDFMLAADFDIESYEQCAFEGIEYVTDYLI